MKKNYDYSREGEQFRRTTRQRPANNNYYKETITLNSNNHYVTRCARFLLRRRVLAAKGPAPTAWGECLAHPKAGTTHSQLSRPTSYRHFIAWSRDDPARTHPLLFPRALRPHRAHIRRPSPTPPTTHRREPVEPQPAQRHYTRCGGRCKDWHAAQIGKRGDTRKPLEDASPPTGWSAGAQPEGGQQREEIHWPGDRPGRGPGNPRIPDKLGRQLAS